MGVLALATVLGLLRPARTGRAQPVRAIPPADQAISKSSTGSSTTTSNRGAADTAALAPTEASGAAATLVQFSTPTCARCPATHRQLDAVATAHPGVARLEIHLAKRPELARRFSVMQTPTVLLLEADREVHTRFGGPPRPADLAAALNTVLTTDPQKSR